MGILAAASRLSRYGVVHSWLRYHASADMELENRHTPQPQNSPVVVARLLICDKESVNLRNGQHHAVIITELVVNLLVLSCNELSRHLRTQLLILGVIGIS